MSGYARFRSMLADALDGGFYTIDYLDWLVRTGRAQFWAGEGAAIVTEVKDYPACRAIHGLAAAGDLEEITDVLIPAAESWGRAQGCAFAIIESRPGWARQLRGAGYEPHQVSIRKRLRPVQQAMTAIGSPGCPRQNNDFDAGRDAPAGRGPGARSAAAGRGDACPGERPARKPVQQ